MYQTKRKSYLYYRVLSKIESVIACFLLLQLNSKHNNKFDTYINFREVLRRTASITDEQKDYTNTDITGISLVYTVNN